MVAKRENKSGRLRKRAAFRVSEADWQAYCQRIEESGMKPSEFFRECVLTNRTQVIARVPMSADRKQMLYAINKIGNNLNQLAHAANTARLTGQVTEFTYLSVLDHLRWIEQFLKGQLDRVD